MPLREILCKYFITSGVWNPIPILPKGYCTTGNVAFDRNVIPDRVKGLDLLMLSYSSLQFLAGIGKVHEQVSVQTFGPEIQGEEGLRKAATSDCSKQSLLCLLRIVKSRTPIRIKAVLDKMGRNCC
ncbi:hypothetical protein ROA7745_00622 [Roseovarius aestuarii]|uniref:Uncharacterized protein n=1 Tax=Roseovarius aestuarii TaxID=475083 RepID=A0A1X7BMG6_9RHOB|nr:hypothetical protein ROA7745_00622 [Roseovarius aestuarii]